MKHGQTTCKGVGSEGGALGRGGGGSSVRPEGIPQGGAHAPLMVQEGLRFFSGYSHIHHLPAQLILIEQSSTWCKCGKFAETRWHALFASHISVKFIRMKVTTVLITMMSTVEAILSSSG